MTSDLIETLGRLPKLDTVTVLGIVLFMSLVRHLVKRAIDDDIQQCPAHRAGYQCVHLEGHPGSHRDEFGDYWN